jgi:hypothetical protein
LLEGILTYKGLSAKRILRLNGDGSLDVTFNSGAGLSSGDVRCILVQPDDRMLVGGTFSGTYNGIAVKQDYSHLEFMIQPFSKFKRLVV